MNRTLRQRIPNNSLGALVHTLLGMFDRSELVWDNETLAIKPEGWHWTGFTCYAKRGSFLLFSAEPDTMRGIDIADEHLLLLATNQFAIENELRRILHRPFPKRPGDVAEGVMRQWRDQGNGTEWSAKNPHAAGAAVVS